MKFVYFFSLLLFFSGVKPIEVISIDDCPKLTPRFQRSVSVDDLRIDDIEVIAALGDSITAGMLAKNINTTYVARDQIIEYRGVSWFMGGDPDAPSVAKYVKHFNADVYGASIGQKPARLCQETFFCLNAHHDPEIDVLNAAQSGATSQELSEQVDYLTEYLGEGTSLANKWKLINIFIGSNDVSVSCLPGKNIDTFKKNMKSTIEKLIDNIDYTFINLVGLSQNSELMNLVQRQALLSKIKSNYIIKL
ncbi:uncharacterized protein BX663DRAFT_508281 [Cokeromyces recurvatus]|uniref:uncharacterized protein n=1 Tax=Cokeromyces recurvatus TaxID=90255 RepID=UPI00221F0C7E|nr:uncharacterized protein BX663DRAFT_508281 [Cokeromyces recurvatus]KAI7903340.1 hypothetical protein BX663DRAFT_508281 [Cokeromyces recurvatus]